jgi:hypothetical protein
VFTVEQIRDDIAPFTLDTGRCKDSKYVLQYINDARRLMWPRGDWVGLMETLRIRSYGGHITLPYDYHKAINAQSCNVSTGIDNEWYENADNVVFNQSCWGSIIDLGDRFASFVDYEVDRKHANHRLLIKGEDTKDNGSPIQFRAIGEFGDRLEIKGNIGDDHERVTFNPWIRYFRSVTKEKTVGRIRVYIFDPNRGVEKICAIYEPDDLTPQYRRYRVPYSLQQCYYFRCKKRYRDLLRETDPVEFGTDTLIQTAIAITARRNKNPSEYTAALNLAVEHENQLLKDDKLNSGGRIKLSRQNTVTNLIHATGGAYFSRRFP